MQEMKKIDTPSEYMLALEWDKGHLEKCIDFLEKWDKKGDNYYKGYPKNAKEFDKKEREHLRNCVNFWKERLDNEIK